MQYLKVMIDKIMNNNEGRLRFIVNIERQRSGNALSPPSVPD